MKISKVTAVFFSAVGHTKEVTETIARQIAQKLQIPLEEDDFTLPPARDHVRSFSPDTLVVFGTPTYAGRVPNKVLPFVQDLFKGQNTPAISVVTFGNRNFDSSLTELTQELCGNGFRVFAAGAFVCQHVFSHKLAAGRPDEADIEAMKQFARDALNKLNAAANTEDLSLPLIRNGEPVKPYYTPRCLDGRPAKFLPTKPRLHEELCNNCGICVRVCPMGSVAPDNVALVRGICIKCHACIYKCPAEAKYFDNEDLRSHIAMLEKNFMERKDPETFL